LEIFQKALSALSERRVELAKFLASPQSSRDDVSRWATQLTATHEAIEVLRKAIAEAMAEQERAS
jgi:enolase